VALTVNYTKVNNMFASLTTARKNTGFKFEVILHTTAWVGSQVQSALFLTRAEARAWVKAQGATPHNF
jgi:hypothetical protein